MMNDELNINPPTPCTICKRPPAPGKPGRPSRRRVVEGRPRVGVRVPCRGRGADSLPQHEGGTARLGRVPGGGGGADEAWLVGGGGGSGGGRGAGWFSGGGGWGRCSCCSSFGRLRLPLATPGGGRGATRDAGGEEAGGVTTPSLALETRAPCWSPSPVGRVPEVARLGS